MGSSSNNSKIQNIISVFFMIVTQTDMYRSCIEFALTVITHEDFADEGF